jgi:hypothetical protein
VTSANPASTFTVKKHSSIFILQFFLLRRRFIKTDTVTTSSTVQYVHYNVSFNAVLIAWFSQIVSPFRNTHGAVKSLHSLMMVNLPLKLQLSYTRTQLPPSPRIWTRITRALLVSIDRRHLFLTPFPIRAAPSLSQIPFLPQLQFEFISCLVNW